MSDLDFSGCEEFDEAPSDLEIDLVIAFIEYWITQNLNGFEGTLNTKDATWKINIERMTNTNS